MLKYFFKEFVPNVELFFLKYDPPFSGKTWIFGDSLSDYV